MNDDVGKFLSREDLSKYEREGYLAPLRFLSPEETRYFQHAFKRTEEEFGGRLPPAMRHKSHLAFPWVNELIRHPKLLDAVEDILGPNILCWTTNFFIKEAQDPAFVAWHQDAPYWGLSPFNVLTAWVALTESTLENGCLNVVPRSHHLDLVEHVDTFDKTNLLSRGQEIKAEVDESKAVALQLLPGQTSFHHIKIIHGSEANRSLKRRVGIAIRYLPTSVRQTGKRDSATLVRGVDRFHHFDLESPGRSSQLKAIRRQLDNAFNPQKNSTLATRFRLQLRRRLHQAGLFAMGFAPKKKRGQIP